MNGLAIAGPFLISSRSCSTLAGPAVAGLRAGECSVVCTEALETACRAGRMYCAVDSVHFLDCVGNTIW